ncbi:MAG: hypothetical protein IKO80_03670 [Lachnospiraceae bacterium]|nr:hypothetical protein [Lachnospiraceae bacterium]
MAMTKIDQDALSSLTGNLPKAVLYVRKYSGDLVSKDKATRAKEQENALKGAKDLQKALMKKTKSALGGSMGTASYEDMVSMGKKNGFTAMQVQYNPSSIYMDTSAGLREIDNSNISNIMNNQITQINTEAITTMAMQLVFDDMDLMDAFMIDSMGLNTGNLVSGAAKLAGTKRTKFSVRTEVEGLIACLFSPVTRQVIFAWSDMIFRGELFQVNANYTMFNKYGDPIRATVEVSIQQDHLMEGYEKGSYWDSAFDETFGTAGADLVKDATSDLTKKSNNALLNLSI